MDEHWHVYWKNPGDSGLPVRVEWTLPEGFQAGELQWPYPQRIKMAEMMVYAYEGEVFLLTEMQPPANLSREDTPLLEARIKWLSCEVSCIPGEVVLGLRMAVSNAEPMSGKAWIEAFARTRENLPTLDSNWNITAAHDEQFIYIDIAGLPGAEVPNDLYLFPADGDIVNHFADQTLERGKGKSRLSVPRSNIKQGALDRIEGLLYSEQGWLGGGDNQALAVDVLVQSEVMAASAVFDARAETSADVGFLLALLFAFIGGLILNLMPCVLPVLSLKIMGFVSQANEENVKPWAHGLAYTVGVLLSFWLLSGALLLVRAGGAAVGWGFQLQTPGFVLGLAIIFFIFSLNLLGVFEIGNGLTGIAQGAQKKKGLTGSLLTGVLAVIVATPCTAPFMGSALGYALSRAAVESLVIFTALGLGLALPYLLLALFPAWIKFIPKPGKWMIWFKQSLGFVLMATVIWLVWVYGLQRGMNALALGLMGLLFLAISCWLFGARGEQSVSRLKSSMGTLFIALIFVCGLLIAYGGVNFGDQTGYSGDESISSEKIDWQAYSASKLAELRREGVPVFLDFTAAWCLTCKVNERLVLESDEVAAKIKALGIVALKADWTSRNAAITAALADFGRSSVPLYVLYGPDVKSAPKLLPEVLTKKIVLEALDSVMAEV